VWHGASYDAARDRVVLFGGYDGGFLDDTWERRLLAGVLRTHVLLPPATSPSARQAVLAYDPVRNVVVLFGGRQFNAFGDTWEYDGTTWKQRTFATSPSARFFAGMVFDPSRNKIVLFGGATGSGGAGALLDDTWEYDGTSWTPLTTTGKPSPRANFAMTYSAARGKVVLFGGATGAGGMSGETWELGGTTWTNVAPSVAPPARTGAAMAFLAKRNRVVLFGGGVPSVLGATFADTWEYDGTWTQVALPDQPEATALHTLVAVPDEITNGDKLVLVAGQTGVAATDHIWEYREVTTATWRWSRALSPVSPSNRTTAPATTDASGHVVLFGADRALWTFDGTNWTASLSPANGPTSRANNAIAYDSSRDALAIFGGLDSSGLKNDTWIYNGTTLAQLPTTGGPSPRHGAAAIYDPSRGVTVMFGGATPTLVADTWEFDTAWQPTSATGPSAQFLTPMGYDPSTKRVVLLDFPSGETWAYDGAWVKLGVPPLAVPISGAQMTFDPWRRKMVLFGGFDANSSVHDEVLELGTEGWTPRAVTGDGPRARYAASLAVHRATHALVMFGGTDVASYPGDTWLLRYVSDTPDEDCADGKDNDGDAREDAADPDCALP
jgi:hypothetical protein